MDNKSIGTHIGGPEDRIVSARLGGNIFISDVSSGARRDLEVVGEEGVVANKLDPALYYRVLMALIKQDQYVQAQHIIRTTFFSGKTILVLDGIKRRGITREWVAKINDGTIFLDSAGVAHVTFQVSAPAYNYDTPYDYLDEGLAAVGSTNRFLDRWIITIPLVEVCNSVINDGKYLYRVMEGTAVEVCGIPITFRTLRDAEPGTQLVLDDPERRISLHIDSTPIFTGSTITGFSIAVSVRMLLLRNTTLVPTDYSWYDDGSSNPYYFEPTEPGSVVQTGGFTLPDNGWYEYDMSGYFYSGNPDYTVVLAIALRALNPGTSVAVGRSLVCGVMLDAQVTEANKYTQVALVATKNVVDVLAIEGLDNSFYIQCCVDPYTAYSGRIGGPRYLVWGGRSGPFFFNINTVSESLFKVDLSVAEGLRLLDQYNPTKYLAKWSGDGSRYSTQYSGISGGGGVYVFTTYALPSVVMYSLAGGRAYPTYRLDYPVVRFGGVYASGNIGLLLPLNCVPLQEGVPQLTYKEYGGYMVSAFYIFGHTYCYPYNYPEGILAPPDPDALSKNVLGRYDISQMEYANVQIMPDTGQVTYVDRNTNMLRYRKGKVTISTTGDFSSITISDSAAIGLDSGMSPVVPMDGGTTTANFVTTYPSYQNITDTAALDPTAGFAHIVDATKAVYRECRVRYVEFIVYDFYRKCYISRSFFLRNVMDPITYADKLVDIRRRTADTRTGYLLYMDNIRTAYRIGLESNLFCHAWDGYHGYSYSSGGLPTTALYKAGDTVIYAIPPNGGQLGTYEGKLVLLARLEEFIATIDIERTSIVEKATLEESWQAYRKLMTLHISKFYEVILDEINDLDITLQASTSTRVFRFRA